MTTPRNHPAIEEQQVSDARDRLAEMDGWSLLKRLSTFDVWWHAGRQFSKKGHPFPLTLDAAAAALPEGWRWMRQIDVPGEGLTWLARKGLLVVGIADTGDEIADRYNLALAARLAASAASEGR